MPRGGRAKDRQGPERRCIATGQSGPRARLIRFVLGPGAVVVPDLAAKLPGRGVWLTADRGLVAQAVKKKAFSRAFRASVTVPEGLIEVLEGLAVRRLVDQIALARKAGEAVTGFEKVRARLAAGQVGALIAARDGAAGGRSKLSQIGSDVPMIAVLDAAELGLAFGRDFAIHAALGRGGFAARAIFEADRLTGLRSGAPGAVVPLAWTCDDDDVDAGGPDDDGAPQGAEQGDGPGEAGADDGRMGAADHGGTQTPAAGVPDGQWPGQAPTDDAGKQGPPDGPGQDD